MRFILVVSARYHAVTIVDPIAPENANPPTIRVLVETCLKGRRAATPDEESEIVLGDWCEEHGLIGIANALRQPNHNTCWSALAHLLRCFEADFWVSATPAKSAAATPPSKKKKKR